MYDKIRLHIWCEDVKFSFVKPGTFLEFDDILVDFVTKSKQMVLQSKIRDVSADGKSLQLPMQGSVKLYYGQSISIACLLRTMQYVNGPNESQDSIKDVNMMLQLKNKQNVVLKKLWALPNMRHIFSISCQLRSALLVLSLKVHLESKSERVTQFK